MRWQGRGSVWKTRAGWASCVVSSTTSPHTSEWHSRRSEALRRSSHSLGSHLHVHLLSSDFSSHPGASVGQAHLLEDVIDLLESGVDFEKRTLTYSLGEHSHLLGEIRAQRAGRR